MLQASGLLQPKDVFMRSWVYHPRFFLDAFLAMVSLVRFTFEMKVSCISIQKRNHDSGDG